MNHKKVYPLGISLAIHTLALGIFILWLSYDVPKKPPEPLKIHISSMITPATPTPQLPIPKVIVPQKEIPKPIQKNIPIPPKMVPKPSTPKPAVVAPAVSRPASPVPPQPIIAQAPKTIDAPKAPHAPPPPPLNVEKEFLNAHLGEIRSLLLQNMKYPKNAQRLKMQGEVRISFSLATDGSV
ncbi:MAG: energy transducer TonB, partial [Sulfuricurvum sp.]